MVECNNCKKISNCPYAIQGLDASFEFCHEYEFNVAKHDNELLHKFVDRLMDNAEQLNLNEWHKFKGIVQTTVSEME